MKTTMCPVYAEFLEQLLYSIDHIDWNKERQGKMMTLLNSLEKKHHTLCYKMEGYQKKTEMELQNFVDEKISESELIRRLTKILNQED